MYDIDILSVMGCPEHFTEELAQEAVSHMENEDGTKGAHWPVDEVKRLIRKHNVDLGEYNIYDAFYVVNMLYSDYYPVVKDEKNIVKLMELFLFDKDAPEGKALKYYRAMKG